MIRKRLIFKLIIFFASSILFLNSCSADKNKALQEGYRIISLSPHITEILFKLDAGKSLVAVTDFCRFPEEAIGLEKIGGLLNPNIEKIIALKPTHIFGIPGHADLAAILKQFNIEITMLPNETIADFTDAVLKIGRMIDKESTAQGILSAFRDSLSLYTAREQKQLFPAVLVIGRESGSLRNVTVAGTSTFISELWEMAGGANIYADLPMHYAGITIESLLIRDPQVIIELSSDDPAGVMHLNSGTAWYSLKNVSAVKLNNIYKITGNHTLIPGPRMLSLARDFAEVIRQVHDEKRLYSDIYR